MTTARTDPPRSPARKVTRARRAERPAAVSVVLPTDSRATIAPVVRSLAAQTIASEIELVVVSPARDECLLDAELVEALGSIVVVHLDSLSPLAGARATGVREARAPLVYLAETHALLDPGALEALVRRHAGPWPIVAPAFRNGNPRTAISWAAQLLYHGRWSTPAEGGVLESAASHNAVIKREFLEEWGDRLEHLLGHGTGLADDLHRRGHGVYLETAAQLDHYNISRWRAWLAECFVQGRVSADQRSRGWSRARRTAYVAAGPLLAAVWLARVLRLDAWRERRGSLPRTTLPVMVASACVGVAGELFGFAAGAGDGEPRLTRFEINRARYMVEALE